MAEKVLFVDDDPNVLSGFQRQLRRELDVLVAVGGAAGLQVLHDEPEVAVIVSDMRMPEMNGADFLARAKSIRPDAVQMILSGQAELESTIAAVNDANLFRFLTKPCERDVLLACVSAGLDQYRLVTAERDLLQRTLGGSVELLTDVLSLVNPVAFSRSTRIERYAMGMAEHLGVHDPWELRLAAMLSQLGCVAVPAETLGKIYAGATVSPEEQATYASHAHTAGRLVARIPRLEGVARLIAAHASDAADGAEPATPEEREAVEILRVAAHFDLLLTQGVEVADAWATVGGTAPPRVMEALSHQARNADLPAVRNVSLLQLRVGMVLEDDVLSSSGVLLMSKGQQISETAILFLGRRNDGEGVVQPIRVRAPQSAPTEAAVVADEPAVASPV